jgi:aryl-alcohol dehydrogenase-like predicted oxidoreductase
MSLPDRSGLSTARLGRTGLEVVRLGIGGAYEGLTVETLRAALDAGFNYIDTARAYRNGEDEKIIGAALQGRREQVVLATKTGDRTAAGAERHLHESLQALRTDYIDIWQMHYVNKPEELEAILGPGGALEFARKAQQQGKVRFVGVTGHDWQQVGRSLATGEFDTVLLWYNCAMREAEEWVFPIAQEHDVGVVVMNGSRWGKLLEVPEDWPREEWDPNEVDLYRFVLSHPAVDVAVASLKSAEQVAARLPIVRPTVPLTEEQQATLRRYGDKMRQEGRL